MKLLLRKIPSLSLILIIAVIPFVQSINKSEKAEIYGYRLLPNIISTIASNLRWVLVGLSIITVFIFFKKRFNIINKSFLLIVVFYLFQFSYAIVSETEILRYFGLTAISFFMPIFVVIAVKDNIELFNKYIVLIISFSLVLALWLNLRVVFSGIRFIGFSNNSNLFGLTALFWLTLLLSKGTNDYFNKILKFVIIITIFLTGSRSGILGLFIILLFTYVENLKKIFFLGGLLALILFLFNDLLSSNDIFSRLLNIRNAASDSGREEIWQKAYVYLDQNLLYGHGMGANERLIGTGNLHNCYIRYVLNMGLILTIVSFIPYFIYLSNLLFNKFKSISSPYIGFLFAYTLMNIGEDFYVGIGSSSFLFFNIIVGLVTYELTYTKYKNDPDRRDIYK